MSLAQEIGTRIAVIVIIIDSVAFCLVKRRIKTVTIFLSIGIIALTIIVLLINVFYCLHRRGLL